MTSERVLFENGFQFVWFGSNMIYNAKRKKENERFHGNGGDSLNGFLEDCEVDVDFGANCLIFGFEPIGLQVSI